MGSFANSLALEIEDVLEQTNQEVVDIFIELSESIVNLTPSPSWGNTPRGNSGNIQEYSDGLLANQWYPSVGINYIEHNLKESNNGADSLARIREMKNSKAFLGKDGVLSLSNTVPYVTRVELLGYPKGVAEVIKGYGDWKYWNGSHATPYAMVEQSLIIMKNKLS